MTFVLNEAVVIIKSQGLPQLNSDLKATDARIKKVAETIDKTFGRLTKVRSAPFERLTKGTRSYGSATRAYNKDVKSFAKSTEMLTDALEKALPTMQRAARSLNSIADSSKVARRNIQGFGGSFGKLAQQTQGTNRAFKTTGQQTAALTHRFLQISGATKTLEGQFLSLGSAFIGGFGIPAAVDLAAKTIGVIANTIGDSVKSAASLESRLAEIATISSDVAQNMSGFAAVLGDISVATRTDVGLLSEGLYQTISSGITDTSDALQFLETSANAARAGLTTVEVAVDGLSSTINAFGMQATSVGDVADKFFKTVELGKLRFDDLARGIGLVAPIAVELGVSLEELLAAGAALTAGGNTLRQSFTAVRGVLNAVLRPSEKATKIAKEMGLEFSVSALRTKGLAGFLRDLAKQTGGNAEIMGQLIPRVEGLRGILALTGNQAEKFEKNLQDIINAAGSTDKAVSLINNTFQGQVDLLNQQLSKALRTVGLKLLPTLTEEVKNLNKSLETVDWDGFANNAIDALKLIMNSLNLLGGSILGVGMIGRDFANFVSKPFQGAKALSGQAVSNLPAQRIINPFTGKKETVGPGFVPLPDSYFSEPDRPQKPPGPTYSPLKTTLPQPIVPPTDPKSPVTQSTTQPKRALPLTSAQQKQLDKIVSPANVITPGAITSDPRTFLTPQQRAVQPSTNRITQEQTVSGVQLRPVTNRLEGTRFVAPTVSPAAVTRTPIPGIEGQLVSPGVPTPDAAGVFKPVLEDATSNELGNVATNTQRSNDILDERLGDAQKSLDAMAQAQLEASRRPPVPVPTAFGKGDGYVGFKGFKAQHEKEMRTEQQEGFSNVLKGSAEQLASNFSLVNSAIKGGAAGGLPGALVAVGAELLQMTPSFSRISEGFNRVVEKLVMAIEPVVSALADVLAPVFAALGEVAKALEPAFKIIGHIIKTALAPGLKTFSFVISGLAKVIKSVFDFITRLINTVIGLINKIPGVNIPKIGEQRQREGPRQRDDGVRIRAGDDGEIPRDARATDRDNRGLLNREARNFGVETEAEATRGIQVSRITGPTRDIFVDLLRPLRQLDTTFPAMLNTLKNIEESLSMRFAMAVPGEGAALPRQPNLAGISNARQNNNGGADFGVAAQGAFGGIVIDQIHIHVDQVADIDVDLLQQQLLDNLDVRDRNGGAVFPNNR